MRKMTKVVEEKAPCFRCDMWSGQTKIRPAYGCPACVEAQTREQKQTLHDALIAYNREKREAEAHRVQAEAYIAARLAKNADPALQATEPPHVAQRRLQEVAEARLVLEGIMKALEAKNEARIALARSMKRKVSKIEQQDELMRQSRNFTEYTDQVTQNLLKAFPLRPRCACCPEFETERGTFVETWSEDGVPLTFCPRCAWAVVRCGMCPLHGRRTFYENLAKSTKPLYARDYPPEVLAPFTVALWADDG